MTITNDLTAYGDVLVGVYDLMYGDPGEPAQVVACLSGLVPPPARLVEFGVGTGRLAIELAGRGYAVHGIEASEAMAAELRRKDPDGTVEVTMGDFGTVVVARDVDLCLIACNTLFMQSTVAGQRAALQRAADHLRPGGRLVVEVYEPSRFHALDRPTVQTRPIRPDAIIIDTVEVDRTSQLMYQVHTLIEAGRVSTLCEVSRYAWPAELDLMAELAGLSLEHRWADWTRRPFDDAAQRHVSVYVRGGE